MKNEKKIKLLCFPYAGSLANNGCVKIREEEGNCLLIKMLLVRYVP